MDDNGVHHCDNMPRQIVLRYEYDDGPGYNWALCIRTSRSLGYLVSESKTEMLHGIMFCPFCGKELGQSVA